MINFSTHWPPTYGRAVACIRLPPIRREIIAGGTNRRTDRRRMCERPRGLIDISRLRSRESRKRADGGLRIGALVPNSDIAITRLVEQRIRWWASAIGAGGVGANEQHGVDRRQSSATHPLPATFTIDICPPLQ